MRDLAFPDTEYRNRLKRIRESMQSNHFDGLIITAPEDIYYISGALSLPGFRFECLVLPVEGDPILITPGAHESMARDTSWIRDIRIYYDSTLTDGETDPFNLVTKAISDTGLIGKSIGINKNDYSGYLTVNVFEKVRSIVGENRLRDTNLVGEVRIIKSPLEIECIRKATEISRIGLRAGIEHVAAGVPEFKVEANMISALYSSGSDWSAIPPLVGSGYRSSQVHGWHTHKLIEKQDVVGLECIAAWKRYHSTILRTTSVGEPKPIVKNAHDVAEKMLDTMLAVLKPGAITGEIDRSIKQIPTEAGFGDYVFFKGGYGLGIGFPPTFTSEPLDIKLGTRQVIEPNMVISSEANITPYALNFGIRLGGDPILVTQQGCKLLVPIPDDLRWKLIVKR